MRRIPRAKIGIRAGRIILWSLDFRAAPVSRVSEGRRKMYARFEEFNAQRLV